MSTEDRVYIALTERQARWLLVVVENEIADDAEAEQEGGKRWSLVTPPEMVDIEARLRVGIEER